MSVDRSVNKLSYVFYPFLLKYFLIYIDYYDYFWKYLQIPLSVKDLGQAYSGNLVLISIFQWEKLQIIVL